MNSSIQPLPLGQPVRSRAVQSSATSPHTGMEWVFLRPLGEAVLYPVSASNQRWPGRLCSTAHLEDDR